MIKIKSVIFFFVLLFVFSCNFISLKNISNDFKWKNKKFAEPFNIKFDYKPILNVQVDTINSLFFYKKDLKKIDTQYNIKNKLIKKLQKRNIKLNLIAKLSLKIDSIFFQGYSETVSVYSNENSEYIGDSQKEFFLFKLSGRIMKKDSCISKIFIEKKHNTEPRESFLLPGVIVDGGIGAKSEKMIENVINEFSYRVYLKLKK